MMPGTKSIATFAAGLMCGLLIHGLPARSANAFNERGGDSTREAASGTSGAGGGPLCPSDIAPLGGDGQVNVLDLLQIIGDWGPCALDPDNDNDGWTVGQGDCDDSNPDVYPGAPELCNGIDDDCDGEIDEGLSIGPEPNNLCTQATNLSSIAGDNCGGNSLIHTANLLPAGDIDFLRFTVFEDNDGIVDLYARISLTAPASAPAPLRLTARCANCGSTPVTIDVQPGQSQFLTIFNDDDWPGNDEFEIYLEVRQLGAAPGMCEPYQLTVTCTPGTPTIICGP